MRNGSTRIRAATPSTIMRVLTTVFPASSIRGSAAYKERGEPMKSNESKRNLHIAAAFVSILVALGACQTLLENRAAPKPGRHLRTPRPGPHVRSRPAGGGGPAGSLGAPVDPRGCGRRAGPRL